MMKHNKFFFRKIVDDDINILWESYKNGSFNLPKMDKLEFISWFLRIRKNYQDELLCFKNDIPVAFVMSFFDGWKYEPHVEFFKGLSKRTILEISEYFFNELSRLNEIGIIVVKCTFASKNLFDHLCSKNILEYVGMMTKGDYRGNEYIYSRAGDANRPNSTKQPTYGLYGHC